MSSVDLPREVLLGVLGLEGTQMVLSSRASIPPMRHGKRRAASQATQTAGEMQREGETVAGAEIQSGVLRGHEAQQKLSTESSHPCPFVGGGKAELALVRPSSRAIPELIAGSEGPLAHPLFAQPIPSPWTGWKMWKSLVLSLDTLRLDVS